MVFPARAEEGDDAVGELAEGHGVEGRGVEPVDDERAVAADPFEAFARRAFRGRLGGMQGKRRLLDLFADEGVAEVLRPPFADGLRFRAFGEHQEGHVSPAAGFVEGLAIGRLVVDPDRLDGREFVPARHARDGEPLSVRVLPDPDGTADEAGRIGVGFEGVVNNEGGFVLVGAVIARPGGDGTKTLDRGDEREAALFRVLLVEDEGVNLAAERIEAEAPGPVDEEREFVVGRVDGNRAPDEGEVAWVVMIRSRRLVG